MKKIFLEIFTKINSFIGNHNIILSGLILGIDSAMEFYCFSSNYSVSQSDLIIKDKVFLRSGLNIFPSLILNQGVDILIGAI